jgi:hypothetical protein
MDNWHVLKSALHKEAEDILSRSGDVVSLRIDEADANRLWLISRTDEMIAHLILRQKPDDEEDEEDDEDDKKTDDGDGDEDEGYSE